MNFVTNKWKWDCDMVMPVGGVWTCFVQTLKDGRVRNYFYSTDGRVSWGLPQDSMLVIDETVWRDDMEVPAPGGCMAKVRTLGCPTNDALLAAGKPEVGAKAPGPWTGPRNPRVKSKAVVVAVVATTPKCPPKRATYMGRTCPECQAHWLEVLQNVRRTVSAHSVTWDW